MLRSFKFKIIFIVTIFILFPFFAGAFSIGDMENFYVEKDYDLYQRGEVSAMLIRITDRINFYIEHEWWKELSTMEKGNIAQILIDLSAEFDRKIYPELTSAFGDVPDNSADKSGKITILFHNMKNDAGGYFRTGDQYFKLEYPFSNEKNMVYLNIARIKEPLLPSYLAHEFMHLITFNQKQKLRNVSDEIWLEELRAEFAPSFLNYDSSYSGSYLEKRVKTFLKYSGESLVRWRNSPGDYGAINLFAQYLVDHYGVEILIDSLQSEKTGIESISYALAKNGFQENFARVFSDWTIALLANNCYLGEKYCYLNPNLERLKVAPELYYISQKENTFSKTSQSIFSWSASWNKIIGGKEDLILNIEGEQEITAAFLLCDYYGKCEISFFEPNQLSQEKIFFGFEEKYQSLILVFSAQPKSDFDSARTFQVVWSVETKNIQGSEKEAETIARFLAQIEELKKQIAFYQQKINAILIDQGKEIVCSELNNNLYFGINASWEVSCLQVFLKDQGAEIYPEGLVTGNFLSLTRQAVIRFQEKYKEEILAPLGLERGTGYVGPATRIKINQILGF